MANVGSLSHNTGSLSTTGPNGEFSPPLLDRDPLLVDNPGVDLNPGAGGPGGTLPPPGSSDAGSAARTLAEQAYANLQADLYAFMALFQQLAALVKTAQKLEKFSALDAQVSTLLAAADKMEDAAEKRFKSALTAALVQLIGAAVSLAVSALSLYKTLSAASREIALGDQKKGLEAQIGDAKNLNGDDAAKAIQEAQAALAKLKPLLEAVERTKTWGAALTPVGQSLNTMVQGAGSSATAEQTRDAELLDAAARKDDALATLTAKVAEAADSLIQAMEAILGDLQKMLAEINQSNHEVVRQTITA